MASSGYQFSQHSQRSVGSCEYTSAAKAFIFSLHNVHGYKPVKLAQYRYQGYVIYRAIVMDQRLGVIKGDMTSSYEITLETFTIPSPRAALLTPSLLVTLRSQSAYSFLGVNYLPRLIRRYSTRQHLNCKIMKRIRLSKR